MHTGCARDPLLLRNNNNIRGCAAKIRHLAAQRPIKNTPRFAGILAGDIESNPGPTGIQKGKRRKAGKQHHSANMIRWRNSNLNQKTGGQYISTRIRGVMIGNARGKLIVVRRYLRQRNSHKDSDNERRRCQNRQRKLSPPYPSCICHPLLYKSLAEQSLSKAYPYLLRQEELQKEKSGNVTGEQGEEWSRTILSVTKAIVIVVFVMLEQD